MQVRYNDLKLYEERTDPDGPAMTHSMFAIGWLDLGENKKAEKPFLKNYENIRGPFKVRLLSAHRSSKRNRPSAMKGTHFDYPPELCDMLIM